MNPDSNPNPSSMTPASLPSVPQQAAQPGMTPPPAASIPSQQTAEAVNEAVKGLVAQYQQDPYKLSGALQQLKAKYLADNFHINPNSAEN